MNQETVITSEFEDCISNPYRQLSFQFLTQKHEKKSFPDMKLSLISSRRWTRVRKSRRLRYESFLLESLIYMTQPDYYSNVNN